MKKSFISTPKIQKKLSRKKAFALVLSLALMGFMVLLIVTLATMVQMQMRLSRQSMNDFKAKQAAKFAAYQAMSRVQTALGPDQRITANAMIFDDTVASPITELDRDPKFNWWSSPMNIDRDQVEQIDDASISQNRYWVGVWDSRRGYAPDKIKREQVRSEYITNTVERALTWLVSGNPVRHPESTDYSSVKFRPTSRIDDGKYVRAVSSGSYTDEYGAPRAERDVLAPLVTLDVDPNPISGEVISDGKETRIAWYVADENQKASLNAVASREMIEHAEKIDYRKQSLPFYSGIHGLTLPGAGGSGTRVFDLDFQDGDDSSSISRIRNLMDVKQLDIFRSGNIPSNMQLSKLFYHSASFNTKGILVNVRDGGLKKDLSLGLTRKDFGNEDEELKDTDNDRGPEYFERPYGVAGYDFKTTAYPLLKSNVYQYHINPNKSNEPNRKLNGAGHIFGPQMYGHENIADAESLSTIKLMGDMFSDKYIWKDPGGPLWDQLRSYYNTRGEDLAERDTHDARVQTDDRFGLKPVVKRFQVFYVPTFVNYGGQKYGLRLHIMPLLILYNPYDVKIKGDTYYAIRVWGQFRHPTGAFRFAIGYETGKYFQCIRDLRTEMMPSMNSLVTSYVPDKLRLQQFMVPYRFGAIWSQTKQSTGSSPKHIDNNSSSPNDTYPVKWLMSRYTAFYQGFNYDGNENNKVPAYPLGYGTRLRITSPQQIKDQIAPNNLVVDYRRTTEQWKSIVAESNIVPGNDTAVTVATTGKSRYAARVARIPLYLNSIVYAVTHGSYFEAINKDSNSDNYLLFYAQRAIDAKDPQNASVVFGNPGNDDDANLRFMAYDSKGIDPGKAKIFSMKKIISYVGNPKNKGSSSPDDKDGPNGVLEESRNKSLYEERDAMMHGLDNGGVLGGCFYVDIPHPESEHAAKYVNDIDWRYNTKKGKYILFDLSELANVDAYDVMGNKMSPSITDLRIDMQDIEGIYPRKEMGQEYNQKILGGQFNMTPLGYAISSYNLDYSRPSDVSANPPSSSPLYWNPIHRHQLEYIRLNLDIWIWKREGFEFSKFATSAAKNYGTDHMYTTQIMGPSLLHMRGFRFFCFKQPSFPDPAIGAYGKATASGEAENYSVYTNYHCPGTAMTQSGRTFALNAYRNTDFGSNPQYYSDGYNDGNVQKVDGALKTLFGFKYPFDAAASETQTQIEEKRNQMQPIHRARFYLNWLTLNPRRHSANYWARHDECRMYKSNSQYIPNVESTGFCYDTEGLGDTLPQAIEHNKDLNVSDGNYGYMAQLHSSINNSYKYVPYGLVFALPYANNVDGHESFFNVRPFVNSNITATGYICDGAGRSIPISGQKKTLYNTISRITKTAQAMNQAYGTKDGMTNVGYTVNGEADGHIRVGLKETLGTYQAPIVHILRKSEVISNVANLAGGGLSFGVGKNQGTGWLGEDSSGGYANLVNAASFQRSYGLQIPESQTPTIPIGNSLCPSRVSPERAYHITWIDGASAVWDRNNDGNSAARSGKFDGTRESNYYEDRSVLYDMSWQLNDALWDEYYFSTLPYRRDEAKDTVSSEVAYPQNPRIQYCVSREDYLSLKDLTSESNKEQFEENASKLWVNGAFNVNSTSVDAWKAVLSTYYGQEIRDYQGKSINTEQLELTPIVRWAAPYLAKEFTGNSSITEEDTAFQGFRGLNSQEIEELAASIVEHIKDRGPFYSMSHFVNRVVADLSAEQRYTENFLGKALVPLPAEEDDRKNLDREYNDILTYRISHGQKGVLQAAIDATSINAPYHQEEDYIISVDNERNMSEALKGDENCKDYRDVKKIWENWRGSIGPQATGAPTYLMQQDLLSRLGSFLTVRSDTFKIRAYGEVRNPISGAVEGKAWCEMVIQRTPEYFDSESQNQEAWRISGREYEIGFQEKVDDQRNFNIHVDELNEVNKELGRRFKIVSFRWLNEKEI